MISGTIYADSKTDIDTKILCRYPHIVDSKLMLQIGLDPNVYKSARFRLEGEHILIKGWYQHFQIL